MKKFLIIRLSSIGDIVLTTPVIRSLRAKYPDAIIHYLCKPNFTAIVNSNPYVDDVIAFEKESRSTIDRLKSEQYDFIIDLHRNIHSSRIRRKLKAASATFSKLNIRKWLLVNFKWAVMPDIHIVDRYFEAVAPLDVTNDHQGLDFFIPKKAADEVDAALALVKKPFLAIAVGAAHNTKQIPVSLLNAFCKASSAPVILLGGEGDQARASEITIGAPEHIINLCGTLSIYGSAEVIRRAAATISGDTGMMHIAAALNRPLVSVWGNTVPEFGMTPYMPKHPNRSAIVELSDVKCRPCSKIGFKKCPKKHFNCMNQIRVEQLLSAVEEVKNS